VFSSSTLSITNRVSPKGKHNKQHRVDNIVLLSYINISFPSSNIKTQTAIHTHRDHVHVKLVHTAKITDVFIERQGAKRLSHMPDERNDS
jgi:hypothetical protein